MKRDGCDLRGHFHYADEVSVNVCLVDYKIIESKGALGTTKHFVQC